MPISQAGLKLFHNGKLAARARVVSHDGSGTVRKRSRSLMLKLAGK